MPVSHWIFLIYTSECRSRVHLGMETESCLLTISTSPEPNPNSQTSSTLSHVRRFTQQKKGSIKLHKLHISLSLHPNQSNIIFPKCFLQFFEFFYSLCCCCRNYFAREWAEKNSAQKKSSIAPMQTFFVFVSHFPHVAAARAERKKKFFNFLFHSVVTLSRRLAWCKLCICSSATLAINIMKAILLHSH